MIAFLACCTACSPQSNQQAGSPPYKIKDGLILQVPAQVTMRRSNGVIEQAPVSPRGLSQADEFGFMLYLPSFSTIPPPGSKPPAEWDPDRVGIDIYPAKVENPVSYSPYPPVARNWMEAHLVKAEDYHEMYGLRCWGWLGPGLGYSCYGKRKDSDEDIAIMVDMPPYHQLHDYRVNPQMKAEYFSARFGGVKIFWITGAEQLPHWREIDASVWKTIDAWNVAAPSEGSTGKPAN